METHQPYLYCCAEHYPIKQEQQPMILHLVRCEMCTNEFSFSPLEQFPGRSSAPASWFTLFASKDIQAQEGRHFCSALCLAQWATIRDEEVRKR